MKLNNKTVSNDIEGSSNKNLDSKSKSRFIIIELIKKGTLFFKYFWTHKVTTTMILAAAVLMALISWTLSATTHLIVGGGSTSVLKTIEPINQIYPKLEKASAEPTYNAIGSAAAYAGVKSGAYDYGFLSDPISDNKAVDLYNSENITRFAFATDYILLVYHLPNHLKLNTNQDAATPVNAPTAGSVVWARDYHDGNNKKYFLNFGQYYNPKNKAKPSLKSNGTLNLETVVKDIYTTHDSFQQIFKPSSNSKWKSPFTNTGDKNQEINVIQRETGSGTRDFFDNYILGANLVNKVKKTNIQNTTSDGDELTQLIDTPNSFGYVSFSDFGRLYSIMKSNKISELSMSVAAIMVPGSTKAEIPFDQKTSYTNLDLQNSYAPNDDYIIRRPFTGILKESGQQFKSALQYICWLLDPYPYQYYLTHSHYMTPDLLSKYKQCAFYYMLQQGESPLKLASPTHKAGYYETYNENKTLADKKIKPIAESLKQLINKGEMPSDRKGFPWWKHYIV